MDYSTFKLNNFFIKRNSTYPKLKYPLTQKVREQYDISDDMLKNVAITFSMINAENGLYKIANVPANLDINFDREKYPDEEQYTLTYTFTLDDTDTGGYYLGEFKVDFLGENCEKLTIPTQNQINIYISDSITKTTVI